MDILIKAHSGLRWVVLLLLLAAIFNALISRGKGKYEKKDKMLNLFAMVFLHIQLLIGLILYFNPNSGKINFVSGWMKNSQARFFGLEHLLIMVIAITVITLGRRKAEKADMVAKKHSIILNWYIIGLILILAGIPWPFRGLGTGWF